MPDGSGFPPERSAGGAETPVDRLLRLAEVEQQTSLTRSAIYRRMADGTFPEPRALGGGQVRWRQSAITAWVDALPTLTFRRTPPAY